MEQIKLVVNGKSYEVSVPPWRTLLDVIREDLGLTGTKEGCSLGECGACTVIMEGKTVNSCLVPAFQAQGRAVQTVESIGPSVADELNATGTSQCGACTPGIVMSIGWLRKQRDAVTHGDLRRLMSGNLCRCTGYDGIIAGAQRVLKQTGNGQDACTNTHNAG